MSRPPFGTDVGKITRRIVSPTRGSDDENGIPRRVAVIQDRVNLDVGQRRGKDHRVVGAYGDGSCSCPVVSIPAVGKGRTAQGEVCQVVG